MIRFGINKGHFAIVESKEDFLKYYNKRWKRFDNETFSGFNENSDFPVIIRHIPAYDPHFCGDWVRVKDEQLDDVKTAIDEEIDTHERRIAELEVVKKVFLEG